MSKAADKLYKRFGILLLLLSAYALVEMGIFVIKSNDVVGVVTDYEEGSGGGNRLSVVYYPVVTFKCCNDKDIVFVGKPGVDPPEYAIGENVNVMYDPTRPEDAKIFGFSSMLLFPFVGLGLGGLLWYFHRK